MPSCHLPFSTQNVGFETNVLIVKRAVLEYAPPAMEEWRVESGSVRPARVSGSAGAAAHRLYTPETPVTTRTNPFFLYESSCVCVQILTDATAWI
jgi:hypothetical protein